MKIIKFYNKQNNLVKEEMYDCKKLLRKDVDKGFGRPGGCVVFKEDFDTFRTWTKTREITFEYDTFGRLIKRNDPNNHQTTWKYGKGNNITQECAYKYGSLSYKEDYIYFNGGYKYTTIHYDNYGIPEKPKYTDIIFNPIFTTWFYLNDNGKVIKEEITTEEGKIICNETTYYDNNGRIIKRIHQFLDQHYIRVNEPSVITHIFEYE